MSDLINSEVEELAVIKKNQKKEEGASLVEYALLVALIAVICIITIRLVGQKVSTNFSFINSSINVQP